MTETNHFPNSVPHAAARSVQIGLCELEGGWRRQNAMGLPDPYVRCYTQANMPFGVRRRQKARRGHCDHGIEWQKNRAEKQSIAKVLSFDARKPGIAALSFCPVFLPGGNVERHKLRGRYSSAGAGQFGRIAFVDGKACQLLTHLSRR
jgi:hypothetical protein